MADNTVNCNGIDVYTHDIYYYADQYIRNELKLDTVTPDDKIIVKNNFMDMIFYISDRIVKPSNDDIELLDNIFNIYKRLCAKYNTTPSLEGFSFLVKINRATFTDWANGEYRTTSAHGNTVKKWFNDCKSLFICDLQSSRGTDSNKIFIAKAAYGMVETAPVQVQPDSDMAHMTREQIRERHKMLLGSESPSKELKID